MNSLRSCFKILILFHDVFSLVTAWKRAVTFKFLIIKSKVIKSFITDDMWNLIELNSQKKSPDLWTPEEDWTWQLSDDQWDALAITL